MQVLIASFHKESPCIAGDIAKVYFGVDPEYNTVLEWQLLAMRVDKSPNWAVVQFLKEQRLFLKNAYPGQGLYSIALLHDLNNKHEYFDPDPRVFGKKPAKIMTAARYQIAQNSILFMGPLSRFVL